MWVPVGPGGSRGHAPRTWVFPCGSCFHEADWTRGVQGHGVESSSVWVQCVGLFDHVILCGYTWGSRSRSTLLLGIVCCVALIVQGAHNGNCGYSQKHIHDVFPERKGIIVSNEQILVFLLFL